MTSTSRLARGALTAVQSAAWLALCGGFAYAILLIECEWNFLSWTFHLNSTVAVSLVISVCTLVGIFFLTRTSKALCIRIVAALSCVLVVGFGLCLLYDEAFPRSFLVAATPVWYKTCRTIYICLPLGVLCFGIGKNMKMRKHSEQPDAEVQSEGPPSDCL